MTAVPVVHANGTARPQLRSAPTQDKIAALADAMRGILADPGVPEAQRELDAVRSDCTDAEYEAAWHLAAPAAARRYDGPPPGARMLRVSLAAPPGTPAKVPPNRRRLPRRWPLLVIGSAAAVAIWSGWVALGAMCGFGLVQPLPGIVAWRVDTAITLPVSMEAYGAYALGVWLSPGTPGRARKFAGKSAIGSLVLGTSGQVIYHLLAAAHRAEAPWPVVVMVSCIPVAALAMAAALAHLLRDAGEDATRQDAPAETPPAEGAPAAAPPASAAAEAQPPSRRDTPPPAAAPQAPASRQARRPRKPPGRRPKAGGSKLDAAMTLLEENPAMTVSALMAAGVSEGTARRAKKEQQPGG